MSAFATTITRERLSARMDGIYTLLFCDLQNKYFGITTYPELNKYVFEVKNNGETLKTVSYNKAIQFYNA